MRILHILNTPRAEGTPNLVLDWLATGEHEQEVLVLHASPADLTARLRKDAHWYEEAHLFSLGWRKFMAIASRVRQICSERRPDLVICWPTGFANWVCLGVRLAGVKSALVHCGNPPNRGFRADWMTRYVMWPLQLLEAKCVCCSNFVRDEFTAVPGISRDLFHVVYNCSRAEDISGRVQISRKQRASDSAPAGIMVATLERHKDHVTLLEAVSHIRKQIPTFRLRVVGDGSMRAELEAITKKLELEKAVEFLGARRDVPELLGLSDVFIFSTTKQEGLGSVLLEALAAGLRVVASDVPACREVLAGGIYGTLVPPRDPIALAAAVVRVLQEPIETGKGIAYAGTFSAGRMMSEYLRLVSVE